VIIIALILIWPPALVANTIMLSSFNPAPETRSLRLSSSTFYIQLPFLLEWILRTIRLGHSRRASLLRSHPSSR